MEVQRELLDASRARMDEARRVAVLTGTGFSLASGVRDLKAPDCAWARHPGSDRVQSLHDYVSSHTLRVAAWLEWQEAGLHDSEPNAAHHALVELERKGKLYALVTQSVDGLHRAAGTSPERLIELHGSAREVVCVACCERGSMRAVLERVRAGEEDPPCPTCEGVLRPATVSFEERLNEEDLERAREAAFTCDLLLVLGSTLSVYPAADLVPIAKASGAGVMIVNAQSTPMDGLADLVLHGPVSEIVPSLLADAPA